MFGYQESGLTSAALRAVKSDQLKIVPIQQISLSFLQPGPVRYIVKVKHKLIDILNICIKLTKRTSDTSTNDNSMLSVPLATQFLRAPKSYPDSKSALNSLTSRRFSSFYFERCEDGD